MGRFAHHRSPGAPRRLEWRIGPGDPTSNELEVWYDGGDELGVTLLSPDGQRIGPVELSSRRLRLVMEVSTSTKDMRHKDDLWTDT